MYSGYGELSELAPEEYLKWENFATPWDSLPSNVAAAQGRYEDGLKVGQDAEEFHLSVKGVWSTQDKPKSGHGSCSTNSYEGIGYHANTCHFLHGVIDSGCKIVVHRWNGKELTRTTIQG